MYKYTIAERPDGSEVYVNMITSAAGAYFGKLPYVLNLVEEVLKTSKVHGTHIQLEHEMGRIIGNTDIIETADTDTIYYAQPLKKVVYSRFAKNRYPMPSSKLTIILDKDSDGNFEVTNTWIGPCSPPFPGDATETKTSKQYWETHALAHDAERIQSKTITKVCPYN